jgi:hypothetical protein
MTESNQENIPEVDSSRIARFEVSQAQTPKVSAFENFKRNLEAFWESKYVIATMSVFTIWALFDNDIRLAVAGKDADLGFVIVISIIFFCFILEIFASAIYKADYLMIPDMKRRRYEPLLESIIRRLQIGSFYFWLDWIATLSLIFEV